MNKPTAEQLRALRVRIAELCGMSQPHWWLYPNFDTKLDDMHDAESELLLTDHQKGLYAQHVVFLLSECYEGCDWTDYITPEYCWNDYIEEPAHALYQHLLHATAWQRAIALDRTLSETPIL